MKRRQFIGLVGSFAVTWPLAVRAQQPKPVQRIGVLMAHSESDPEFKAYLTAFRDGLQKLGWTEGRNIQIASRWGALDDAESRQRSAKELIALQPDLILTYAKHTANCIDAATNAHHPRNFCGRCRSGWQPLRREFGAPGRQCHRFHCYGADDFRQVVGAA
jgi:putative ABC transport system substrate-binding protein